MEQTNLFKSHFLVSNGTSGEYCEIVMKCELWGIRQGPSYLPLSSDSSKSCVVIKSIHLRLKPSWVSSTVPWTPIKCEACCNPFLTTSFLGGRHLSSPVQIRSMLFKCWSYPSLQFMTREVILHLSNFFC